jgi:4-hydroxy-tetrahydrodipicolinate synthase
MPRIRLDGVTVVTVLPFAADLSIDWASYERLLDWCATPDGIRAVFVNGHAGEAAALTPEERTDVIRSTRARVPDKPVMAGIIATCTSDAILRTREAKAAGADVAVLFPLPQFSAGGASDPRVGPAFVRQVAEAVDIPLSLFQYPLASGFGFTTAVLREIALIPGLIAIKEGSGDIRAYEDNVRMLRAEAPHVAMLSSNFDWFLAQLSIGADGILSGLASLAPHLFVELWRATERQDLRAMRAVSDELHPIVRAIYGATPLMDMHTRIKVALVHLGIIADGRPRPPLLEVEPAVARQVAVAVDASRLPSLLSERVHRPSRVSR